MYNTFPYFSARGVEFNFFKNNKSCPPTGQYLNIHKQIILHNSMVGNNAFSAQAYYTWSMCSRAPRVRQCGKLPIRENLVITWPYTDRPTESLFAPKVYQWKIIQSIGMATEMQLKVLFGKKSHGPVRLDFRKKKQRKVVSFSMLFFMFTLMWITKNKTPKVVSVGCVGLWKHNGVLSRLMEQNKTKQLLALSSVDPRVTKFDKVPMF